MPLQPTVAHIRPDSPRAAEWREVFGSETVPILSPVPVRAEGPDGEAEFYRLDVERLTAGQRERLVAHLSRKFGEPRAAIRQSIADPEHGVPVLAADVSVSFDARMVL